MHNSFDAIAIAGTAMKSGLIVSSSTMSITWLTVILIVVFPVFGILCTGVGFYEMTGDKRLKKATLIIGAVITISAVCFSFYALSYMA